MQETKAPKGVGIAPKDDWMVGPEFCKVTKTSENIHNKKPENIEQ